MTRSQSLAAELNATAAITGMVADRLYPLVALPPSSRTTLVYRFEADYKYVISGVERIDARLDIRSFAAAYETAHALADAVQAVLMPPSQAKGYNWKQNGPLGGVGGIKVIHCLIDREEESLVPIAQDQFIFEVLSRYDMRYIL